MTGRDPAGSREALRPWVRRNVARLGLYLLVASGLTAVFIVAALGIFSVPGLVYVWFTVFLAGGLFCLPGMCVWLVVIARLPLDSTTVVRRTIAVGSGVIIGVPWQIAFARISWGAVAIWGVLLPMGSGLVVRFRGWSDAVAQPATTGVSSAM